MSTIREEAVLSALLFQGHLRTFRVLMLTLVHVAKLSIRLSRVLDQKLRPLKLQMSRLAQIWPLAVAPVIVDWIYTIILSPASDVVVRLATLHLH